MVLPRVTGSGEHLIDTQVPVQVGEIMPLVDREHHYLGDAGAGLPPSYSDTSGEDTRYSSPSC